MYKIEPNDFIKITLCGERFWLKVLSVFGDKIVGVIDNDLLNSDQHGLRLGSQIVIDQSIIEDVLAGSNPRN